LAAQVNRLLPRLLLLVLLLSGLAAHAESPIEELDVVQAFGHDYFRVQDWTAANKFQFKWTRKDEEFLVTTKKSTLLFTVDSRRAVINGVAVWLSVPVARANSTALVAIIDLKSALLPILYPPKLRKGQRIKTVCLDPGHGGKDSGNTDGVGIEKDRTLALAREVGRLLRESGYKVVMTRNSDKFLELDERAEFARRQSADLFVSLHFNASASPGARGIETYCLTPPRAPSTNTRQETSNVGALPGNKVDHLNVFLAHHVQKSMVHALGSEDRGVKRARFVVLKTVTMPAILVEGGFMSDPHEGKKISDRDYGRNLARSIVSGITTFRRFVEH
jgi:N-acetylmuramoyl-L-alanine amidase